MTSSHSWKAGSLNSPQTPLWLLAPGAEESRAENGVLLHGWPKDPQNPQYAQIRRESREALGTPWLRGSRAPVLPALCDPAAFTLLLETGPFPGTPPVLQGRWHLPPIPWAEDEPCVSAARSASGQQLYQQLFVQRPLTRAGFNVLQTRHCVRTLVPAGLLQSV